MCVSVHGFVGARRGVFGSGLHISGGPGGTV